MRTQSVVPNAVTIIRGLLVVPVVVLMLRRTPGADWVAFGAFLFAALTDGVDGALARRWQATSSAGQFLDPLVDKVLVVAAMATLVYLHRFPWWAALVIVARELAVTVLRIAASRRGRGFPASAMGKWKTTVQLAAVAAYVIPSHALAWRAARLTMLTAAIALTVASGAVYIRRAPAIMSGR